MGSNGPKGYKGILGSNTQRVIRNSSVPVLIVKGKFDDFKIKNILFASTFEKSAEKHFKTVTELANVLNAKVHLLNVNTPHNFKETDAANENIDTFLKPYPKGAYPINIINALNEERGIINFSQKNEIDVIVLSTHGKSGLKKLISPSITEGVINNSDIPVITFHL